jgi:hypothetical protein
MAKRFILYALLMFSVASVVGIADTDREGPTPGCYPCPPPPHGN